MTPASVHAEPVCNDQTARVVTDHAVHEHLPSRELSGREHVARNYRAIALPALAAAVRHVAQLRAARNAVAGTSASLAEA